MRQNRLDGNGLGLGFCISVESDQSCSQAKMRAGGDLNRQWFAIQGAAIVRDRALRITFLAQSFSAHERGFWKIGLQRQRLHGMRLGSIELAFEEIDPCKSQWYTSIRRIAGAGVRIGFSRFVQLAEAGLCISTQKPKFERNGRIVSGRI